MTDFRIIETMGSLLKEQHLLLQSYDYLTPSFVARFESVEKMLEGAKEVSWSDQNGNAVATTSKILELPDCTIRKFGKNGLLGKGKENEMISFQD